MIIALTGNIGCGKDTVAKMIQYYFATKNNPILLDKIFIEDFIDIEVGKKDMYNLFENSSDFLIKKFASKLKQICAILVGCKEEDFESQEFKNSYLPLPMWKHKSGNFSLSYRQLLQKVATDCIRDLIHEDVWVNALMCDYKRERMKADLSKHEIIKHHTYIYPNWIISDLRFLNEAKAVKDNNGIIIKIERYAEVGEDLHISETELNKIKHDYLIENFGSISDLYNNVCRFCETHLI